MAPELGGPVSGGQKPAHGHCLERMKMFVEDGTSFYSLSEGLQDTYLGLLYEQVKQAGKTLESETQVWAEDSC